MASHEQASGHGQHTDHPTPAGPDETHETHHGGHSSHAAHAGNDAPADHVGTRCTAARAILDMLTNTSTQVTARRCSRTASGCR